MELSTLDSSLVFSPFSFSNIDISSFLQRHSDACASGAELTKFSSSLRSFNIMFVNGNVNISEHKIPISGAFYNCLEQMFAKGMGM